tara:strand:+ start:31515 stop:31766 length:252 start_codon:yes stop_codon:yes gene_type:complete
MTEQKLLEKLTGVNNPRFITPREDAIIKECLAIINNLEKQLLIHSVVGQSEQLEDFVKYIQEKHGRLLDMSTETLVEKYKSSN